LADLIPETREWTAGRGIDLASWACGVGGAEQAIGFGELFWPEFVEHDGCIFFADAFDPDNYRGFMASTGGDRRAVEAVMNHRHVLDLFPGHSPTREQVVYLGRLLREMWAVKLRQDFPDRPIVVRFPEDGCEDLLDYEVSFYQGRKPS
jgi:hypothetical protein